MIKQPDVDTLMAGPLGQWLAQQKGVREEAKAKSNTRYVWAAVGLLPIISFLWFTPLGFQLKAFLTVAAGMGGAWWGYLPRAAAIKETKSGINSAVAEALGISYAHDCEAGQGFMRAKTHKMLPSYTRASFEDLWAGDFGTLPFTLHEAHLERKQGSGKNSRWVTVFRGPIITIGCTRDFYGVTLLERAGKHQKFLFFGEADTLTLDGVSLDKAEMVHPDFEDAFSVFTSDQVEARYLVHPVYIEKLVELERAFYGKDIRTLFKAGQLTIVLASENMFESGSLDASRDREMVETCIAQFTSMANLAAALNEPGR